MKKIIGFLLIGFALQASAQNQQSDSLDFLVRKRQYSARLGLFNYEVAGEFRVGKKQVLLTSLGLGGSWEHSIIFRKNYKELGHFDSFLYFGDSWFSVYTNVEYRVYVNKSRFGNSGFYLGGKGKVNFSLDYHYGTSYKYGGILGYQQEFGKRKNYIFDIQLGPGLMTNFDFQKAIGSRFVNTRFLAYVFSRKK